MKQLLEEDKREARLESQILLYSNRGIRFRLGPVVKPRKPTARGQARHSPADSIVRLLCGWFRQIERFEARLLPCAGLFSRV